MRSAHVFSAVEPSLIRERLDSIGRRAGNEWVIGDCLWVHIDNPPNWLDGFASERDGIERELGDDVTVVAADVSSTIDGTAEARAFALVILGLGPGLAFDDHGDRGWTAAELTNDECVVGRMFFSEADR